MAKEMLAEMKHFALLELSPYTDISIYNSHIANVI